MRLMYKEDSKMGIPDKTLLRPGDILLLMDEPTNTTWKHKMIKLGQAVTSLNVSRGNQGSSSLVHAVIWTRTIGNKEPEIAEASGTGSVRTFDLRPGYYVVCRPLNPELGDWAAQVALMWAAGGGIAYAKGASVQSIAHSDSFGKNGQARAALYARDAFSNTPAWGDGGGFCSQFVLACYQGAAGQMNLPLTGALAADAQHTSVRALHDRLIRDTVNFSWEGF